MEDKAIKHGPLLTPPQGKLLKRAWQRKYYALYKASGYAVERVEVFDSEDNYMMGTTTHKIIPLNECIKVAQAVQKNQQNVFEVITKGHAFQFSTETTQDLIEWVTAFQLVAFGGGQRRDVGSTTVTPSPHLNRSFNENSRSSVESNAEEENQIYCSFGEPETYAVSILETPAAAVCGLRGEYLLAVGTSQLQLMTDDILLFSWPYRHIRRYGRSSQSFTFEAGRKCASGAGTFSFSTPRGNDIFVSMQASTRNLKREVDGGGSSGASLTTNSGSLRSLAAPRAVLSWPSMEEGLPPPPPTSSPPPHTRGIPSAGYPQSNPPSMTTRSTKSESKESPPSILDRVLSRTKAIPPFAKPPRRSKLGSPVVSEPTTPSSPEPTFRLEISSAARAKLVAEVSAAASAMSGPHAVTRRRPASEEVDEPTYAVPEQRCDAWKTLGESDDFHRERVPEVDDYSEGIYEVVTGGNAAAGGLDSVVPLPQQQQQQWPARSLAADGYNYDHLSMFSGGHQVTSPPTSSSPTGLSQNGHIYTRLTPTTLTPPSHFGGPSAFADGRGREQVTLESGAGEAGTEADGTVPDSSIDSSSSAGEDLKRFIQNEEVYTAVVKKPLKKLNLSSIEV